MSKLKITRFAPWMGSKSNLAPSIVPLLDNPKSYWEPFCGSAAVYQCILQSDHQLKYACLNDMHGELINFLLVLADPDDYQELMKCISFATFNEASFDLYKSIVTQGQLKDMPKIKRAFIWFMFVWIGCNGTAGTCDGRATGHFPIRWNHEGGDQSVRFWRAVDCMPTWHEMLRRPGTTILNRDGFGVIKCVLDQNDKKDVALYLDPPYLLEGDQYEHGWHQKQALFDDQDNHDRLAELANQFTKARVVVSYADHPRLEDLYPPSRWEKIVTNVSRNLSNLGSQSSDKKRMDEVLLVNKLKGKK